MLLVGTGDACLSFGMTKRADYKATVQANMLLACLGPLRAFLGAAKSVNHMSNCCAQPANVELACKPACAGCVSHLQPWSSSSRPETACTALCSISLQLCLRIAVDSALTMPSSALPYLVQLVLPLAGWPSPVVPKTPAQRMRAHCPDLHMPWSPARSTIIYCRCARPGTCLPTAEI